MRPGRLKVCFVLPSLAGGGAERAAVHVANALDASGWQRAMYLFAREGPYLSEVAADVTLASGGRASRAGRWQDLRAFVRRTAPDVVVAFLSYFSVLTAVRAARTGARVVFNLQTPMSAFLTDADYHWRRRWHRAAFAAVTRAGYGAADLIVATSHGVADDLRDRFGVAPGKTRVVPNPVDLDRVRSAAAEPLEPGAAHAWRTPTIVAAGRLADAKNYPLMLEALALVRARVPAHLVILGQGAAEPALRGLAAARGVADAVTFAGFQANPWKYIARADVFALTSRYEGFGNVLIEAMACGVPVVATASPGTRDIVEDGVTGQLVEAHAPEAVAAALTAVLTDRERRAAMSAAARQAATRYALPAVAAEYDRVLREACA